jgi:heme/copper-type cytochrome/quinol oxidase subunit 3
MRDQSGAVSRRYDEREVAYSWRKIMSIRMVIALVIYMMVQGCMFGVAIVALLVSPFSNDAMQLLPWVIGTTALISVPLSWVVAKRLLMSTELRCAG